MIFLAGLLLASFNSNQKSKQQLQIVSYPVLSYSGFSLQYDAQRKIPFYTYEYLSKESLKRNVSRSQQHFKKDPAIYHLHQSSPNDYSKAAFDKGHMVPAADQLSSKELLDKTFLLSNICPQNSALNRGLWAKLEQQVRSQVADNQNIEVVTGPLFLSHPEGNKRYVSYQVIGENEVAVPTHFFKLIYANGKALAYVIPNVQMESSASLEQYQVSLDYLEKVSGLHFQMNK